MRTFLGAGLIGLTALLVYGCGTADLEGDFTQSQDTTAGKTSTQTAAGSCNPNGLPTIAPADPGTFPKCSTPKGSSRCVPPSALGAFADKVKAQAVPAGSDPFLQSCDGGGYCIPDDLIKTGGAKPASCKSINGDGVCLDLSIPLLAKYDTLLPQDTCSATQKCAPCTNPLAGGADTGACLIGTGPAPGQTTCSGGASTSAPSSSATKLSCPYTGPALVDASKFAACGDGMNCIPGNALPDPKLGSLLGTCQTSDKQNGFCAPKEFIETAGNFVPATCNSLNGAEGRCINQAIPSVKAQATFLPQDTCKASEKCAPCFNPADGKPTGSCSISCDKGPTKPAVTFPACGGGRGVCVPKDLAGATGQFLKADTCNATTELCAPKEVVANDPNFKPTACNGDINIIITQINYTGVCLSDLISAPGNVGDCPANANLKCVPCTNPVSGKATGAPGCPASP